MLLLIESGLVILALVLALICPQVGSRWFEKLELSFAALAHRRTLSVVVVDLLALALRTALLLIEPIPEPIVHDEFGYLLAADTFAHGRLTNPTHPMWVHFESFSIIQKPTYQCAAQPAQGLLLALGQVVFGHPFWGLWLGGGLMCAAVCWMLQAWLSPTWALIGGFLAILRYATFTYWVNSYWGGLTGAIGGALVLGALPRIKQSHRIRDALFMAAGLAILANSRPYEGFIFSLPIAVSLFLWMFSPQAPNWKISLPRVVLPLCIFLAITGVAMGYYLWRVTGSPFRLPYQVERQQYGVAPYFLWQPLRPEPTYHSDAMRQLFTKSDVTFYTLSRTPIGFAFLSARKFLHFWQFYLGPVLSLPLIMLFVILPYGFSWRHVSRQTLFLAAAFGISAAGWLLEIFFEPHYASPATGLTVALILIATRRLFSWAGNGRCVGRFLTRAMLIICALTFALRVAAAPLHFPLGQPFTPAWYQAAPPSFGRSMVNRELQPKTNQSLVIVRYKPDHIPFDEWVYNGADIDRTEVVWAREMSRTENAELIKYFQGRQVFLLQADEKPPALSPYPCVVSENCK